MPTGTEDHLDIVLLDAIQRLADIVDVRDHEIDMMEMTAARWTNCERVVERIGMATHEDDAVFDQVRNPKAEVINQGIARSFEVLAANHHMPIRAILALSERTDC